MKISDIANKLNMKVLAGEKAIAEEVTGVYVCDLLSWVMSHARKGDAWITVHTHVNIVAVALLTEVSCIIIPEGIKVEEQTVNKANEEGIVILSTECSAYEVCCMLYELVKQ